MQAVVFGGTGFIGRSVVQRLAAAGWQVAVATRSLEKGQALKPLGNPGQITPFLLALDDEPGIARAVAMADAVINLTGILYEKGRATFEAVHHHFPEQLARLCAAAHVKRLIHLSAIGASADSPSAYARSKADGEQAMRQHFPKASILRPSIVFGADDNFFNQFARLSLASPFLPLPGGGDTRFQPVYVGDVSAAVMACLERPDTAGQVYELGGDAVYTFRQLLEKVGAYTGRRRCLLSLPWGITGFVAFFTGLLPVPPLTRDQVRLLGVDNVVSPAARTLADLDITPTALENVVPDYLQAYRRGGRWATPTV